MDHCNAFATRQAASDTGSRHKLVGGQSKMCVGTHTLGSEVFGWSSPNERTVGGDYDLVLGVFRAKGQVNGYDFGLGL